MKTIEELFDAAANLIGEKVEKAVADSGQELHVDYCAYVPKGDEDIPLDNLDEIAVQGKVILIRNYTPYRSEVKENPTWLELTLLANEMIIETEDFDHCFFEGIEKVGEENGINIYKFQMGS